MSQWSGHARSNYFQVKDAAAFQAEFAAHDVEIWEGTRDPFAGMFALAGADENGGWPTNTYNESTDEWADIDIPHLVATHLVDGQVAVFQECGHQKLAYLTGSSRAINNKFEEVVINLDDIYVQAKHLGANMTLATD